MKAMKKMQQRLQEGKKNNKGFSLVELIIVIAIMAILVGIVGTQVLPYLNRSREAKDQQILSEFATAAVSAYSMCAEDVPTGDNLVVTITGTSGTVTNTSGVAVDAGSLVDTIVELTNYSDLSDDSIWSSSKGKSATGIEITYNFTSKQVVVIAVGSSGDVGITEADATL